jgi:hypothetical protein
MAPQPPFMRWRYQGISCWRFSTQTSKNWQNDMYAHNITKAKSRLPRSFNTHGAMMRDNGSRRAKK